MGKPSTIYSDNPKMNTAKLPDTPGYADGGMVYGDTMELMQQPRESVTDELVRKAARERLRSAAEEDRRKEEENRRKAQKAGSIMVLPYTPKPRPTRKTRA